VTLGREILLGWVRPSFRDRAEEILAPLQRRLTRWVWAQMAIAAYFALVFSLGLTLLGVPFALTVIEPALQVPVAAHQALKALS
jgi:predicted PurR-regulated permease PerM